MFPAHALGSLSPIYIYSRHSTQVGHIVDTKMQLAYLRELKGSMATRAMEGLR